MGDSLQYFNLNIFEFFIQNKSVENLNLKKGFFVSLFYGVSVPLDLFIMELWDLWFIFLQCNST